MVLRSAIAIALTCSMPLIAAGQRQATPSKTPSLAERFPVPDGYSAEQDTESDGTQNFSTAANVRGHILRRFVQAGDDGPMAMPEIVRFFADRLHAQGGFLFDDRFNSGGGRLDGRIPGPKPVWLHVDISDEGRLLDVIALEERVPSTSAMPAVETTTPGSWSTGEALADIAAADRAGALRTRDAVSALAAPAFQPYQGGAWRVTVETLLDGAATEWTIPYRIRVTMRDASAVVIDVNRVESLDPAFTPAGAITKISDGRILITRTGRPPLYTPPSPDAPSRRLTLNSAYFEAGRPRNLAHFAVIDVPWKHGAGEVSLSQSDLIERFLQTTTLTDIVK